MSSQTSGLSGAIFFAASNSASADFGSSSAERAREPEMRRDPRRIGRQRLLVVVGRVGRRVALQEQIAVLGV